MEKTIYCSPHEMCGVKQCPRHICHAPKGYCVTVQDLAAKCSAYRKRYKIYSDTIEEAMQKIIDMRMENYVDISTLEINGLSVQDILLLMQNFTPDFRKI